MRRWTLWLLSTVASDMIVIVISFFIKQKTAYEMRMSDWSADVCSSDLGFRFEPGARRFRFWLAFGPRCWRRDQYRREQGRIPRAGGHRHLQRQETGRQTASLRCAGSEAKSTRAAFAPGTLSEAWFVVSRPLPRTAAPTARAGPPP